MEMFGFEELGYWDQDGLIQEEIDEVMEETGVEIDYETAIRNVKRKGYYYDEDGWFICGGWKDDCLRRFGDGNY